MVRVLASFLFLEGRHTLYIGSWGKPDCCLPFQPPFRAKSFSNSASTRCRAIPVGRFIDLGVVEGQGLFFTVIRGPNSTLSGS